MSDNLLIETKEIGNHRIKIYYDECPECPITNWDLGASYLFEYSGSLSNHCDWRDWFANSNHTLEDALREIAEKYVSQDDLLKYLKEGHIKDIWFKYNQSTREWELYYKCGWGSNKGQWFLNLGIAASDLKAYDYRGEILENLDEDELKQLIHDCAKDFLMVEWSSRGYSQGDYVEGVAYVSKSAFEERCGFSPEQYSDWKEQAKGVIDAEVEEIGMWLWGDVKRFTLEKKVRFTKVFHDADREDEEACEWESVDSCGGYFLKTEELINEVISDWGLKESA